MTSPENDDLRFMREALKLAAEAAEAGEVPIGAVAVRDGEIIASGRNRVEEKHSVTAHAEFEVIHQLEELTGDWRMSDFTLYVSKEPCPMCAGMLINARIKAIIFGVPDPAAGGCGGAFNVGTVPSLLWHPEIRGGILADEAGDMLKNFFRSRRAASAQAKKERNK